MAYPPHIDRKKLPSAKAYRISDRSPYLPPGLEENIAAGYDPMPPGWQPPSSGPDMPMGGMMGVGGFSPLELGIMGGAVALPLGIAAHKWWNSGPAEPEPTHGRPGDPPHADDGYFKSVSDLFMGKLW